MFSHDFIKHVTMKFKHECGRNVKAKCKVHPTAGHEDPKGEYRYSSNLSLTSALDGVGGQCHTHTQTPQTHTHTHTTHTHTHIHTHTTHTHTTDAADPSPAQSTILTHAGSNLFLSLFGSLNSKAFECRVV